METNKCPVCGNPGIPNYYKEDVICPHCGSDLKIYRTISELADEGNTSTDGIKKYKMLSILLPIVSAVIAIAACYLIIPKHLGNYEAQLLESQKTISMLQDSVSALQALVQNKGSVDNKYIEYTIVPNDCPWSIVQKHFGVRGDWMDLAQEIAEDNGIWDSSTNSWKQIQPGQIIKIKKSK